MQTLKSIKKNERGEYRIQNVSDQGLIVVPPTISPWAIIFCELQFSHFYLVGEIYSYLSVK